MRTVDDLYRDYPDVLPERGEMRFGDGWALILEPLLQELRAAGGRLDMAKEKLGEMRVRTRAPEADPGRLQDTIDCLTLRSRFTCEQCGKPGRLRVDGNGWYFTGCDEHGHGVEPMPLESVRVITWRRVLDDWWRSYEFDERDRQITITGSNER